MKKILKYLPDFLIQLGIFILSYNILPICLQRAFGDCIGYGGYGRIFGVMFITIGLNILLRRYLINKK